MDISTLLILALTVLLGFGAVIYFLNARLRELGERRSDEEALKMMSEWMKQIGEQTGAVRQEMQDRLDSSSRAINERLDNAARVIGLVSKELGTMSEIGRQMREFQDFLRAPKFRGSLGEQVLYDLLKQSIPAQNLFLQHQFKNGQIVDAAIQTAAGIIPIDSKLPLDNFKKMVQADSEGQREDSRKLFARDVKKHIQEIAKKYILPQEGTVDFALMYINSEPVAYEIIVNMPELVDYAHQKRIGIVSPHQFNHFLQVVMIGFERQRVSQQAHFILTALRAIQADAQKFRDDLRILVKHVTNAKNMADTASSSFDQLSGKIDATRRIQLEEKPESFPNSEA